MNDRGVEQIPVARRLNRAQSFVSERTSGKRPTDTDLIDAIAAEAGMDARDLVAAVLKRMRGDEGGTVTRLPRRRERSYPKPVPEAARKDDD
jgi:hypothetical protein